MENAEPVTACNEHHTFLLVATKLKLLLWNYLPSSFLNAAITSSVTSAWLLTPCILECNKLRRGEIAEYEAISNKARSCLKSFLMHFS
jgi:hypothetical protein